MGLIEVQQCSKEVRQWLNKSHAIKCGKIYAASGLMLSAWNELEGSSTELNSVQPIDYGVNLGLDSVMQVDWRKVRDACAADATDAAERGVCCLVLKC